MLISFKVNSQGKEGYGTDGIGHMTAIRGGEIGAKTGPYLDTTRMFSLHQSVA